MRYKVGDKVKVKSDLKENTSYGGKIFVRDMAVYRGKNVEISKVHDDAYCIKESDREWFWTDKMFEPVEEMSAEEAIKLFGELCHEQDGCDECPIKKMMMPLDVMKSEQSVQKRLLKFSNSGNPTMRKSRLRRNLRGVC